MRNRKPKSNQPRPASNERHPPFVVVSLAMKEPLHACKLKRSSLLRVPGGSARVTEKPSSYLDRELGGRIGVGVLRAACTPCCVQPMSEKDIIMPVSYFFSCSPCTRYIPSEFNKVSVNPRKSNKGQSLSECGYGPELGTLLLAHHASGLIVSTNRFGVVSQNQSTASHRLQSLNFQDLARHTEQVANRGCWRTGWVAWMLIQSLLSCLTNMEPNISHLFGASATLCPTIEVDSPTSHLNFLWAVTESPKNGSLLASKSVGWPFLPKKSRGCNPTRQLL